MFFDLSSPQQHLPANTLLEKGDWLLGAILPTRPHMPKGTRLAVLIPTYHLRSVGFCGLDFHGEFGCNLF